jgi:hypothetical protein
VRAVHQANHGQVNHRTHPAWVDAALSGKNASPASGHTIAMGKMYFWPAVHEHVTGGSTLADEATGFEDGFRWELARQNGMAKEA